MFNARAICNLGLIISVVTLLGFAGVANMASAESEVRVHDAAPLGSYRFDARGSVVAWVDYGTSSPAEWGEAGSIWYQNIKTGVKKKISNNSDYQPVGIKVLVDGIYFGHKGAGAGVYKYDFASEKITQLAALASIGELEKQTDLLEVKIANSYFFEYTLLDKQHASARYTKYYNVNTKKAYGITNVEDLPGGGVSYDATKDNEIIKLSGDSNGLSFSHKTYIGGKYLFFAVSEPASNGQFTGYRTRDLATDEISYVKLSSKQSPFILSDSDSTGDYLIARLDDTDTFRRFNYKKGELGATIVKVVHSSVGVPYVRDNVGGNLMVWHGVANSKESDYLYDVESDKKCAILPVDSFAVRPAQGYIYWQGEGGALYGRPVVCDADSSKADDTPPLPAKPDSSKSGQGIKPVVEERPSSFGTLIKVKGKASVFYYASDRQRYVFPNEKVYSSWFKNFSGVKTITEGQMGSIPLGGNVTLKPGSFLLKFESDPKVYAVDKGGTLRHVGNEQAAKDLYGGRWIKSMKVMPDYLFVNYTLGPRIDSKADYPLEALKKGVTTIDQDKGI